MEKCGIFYNIDKNFVRNTVESNGRAYELNVERESESERTPNERT